MSNSLIIYSSTDGHTKNICERIINFSNDTNKGSLFKLWNIHNSFRLKRTFQGL